MKRIMPIALGLAAVVTLSGCASPDLPSTTASVARVARTYLQAAKSHHCDVTKALTSDSTWYWCDNPQLIHYRFVGKNYSVDAQRGTPKEMCVPAEISSRGSGKSANMNGTYQWSLCFTKTEAGWRLYDQGEG